MNPHVIGDYPHVIIEQWKGFACLTCQIAVFPLFEHDRERKRVDHTRRIGRQRLQQHEKLPESYRPGDTVPSYS